MISHVVHLSFMLSLLSVGWVDGNFLTIILAKANEKSIQMREEEPMQKYKTKIGRQRIQYSYTGEFDAWVPATMEFLGTLMPPTLSKRAAAMLLLVAGMGNEEIVALTGMCIRSVRALRKVMEEQEPTSKLFAIKPGSGRKRKTEGIEEQLWAELDTGNYHTHKAVADMLKERFGIDASVNLAARLMKRWREFRRKDSE